MVARDRKRLFADYIFDTENASAYLKFTDYFHTRSGKHIRLMRRIGKLTRQILPGEVQMLVKIEAPSGAIGHIVDDAFVGNEFA